MKKALAFFLMWFFIIISTGYAQEAEGDSEDSEAGPDEGAQADWYGEMPSLYSLGDKTFTISLGLTFPTVFIHNGKVVESNLTPPLGGIGCLGFNLFLDPHFFLGAEIGGQFNPTLAKNTLYIVPIGLRAGYQFIIWRIEIPLTLVAGIAPQTFLNEGYFGFFLKGGASAYYRFNPDWSFGIDFSWSWFPQWTRVPEHNMDGNFFNLILAARYHF